MQSALFRPSFSFGCLLLLGCLFFFADCTPPQNVCTPGSLQLCVCPDGSQGKRSCADNGYYEPCQCKELVEPTPTETTIPDTRTPPPDRAAPEPVSEPTADAAPDAAEPSSEPLAETPPPDQTPEQVTESSPEPPPADNVAEKPPTGGCDENNPCPAGKGACIQGQCSCLYSKKLATFTGHKRWASDVAFSPNDKLLASVSAGDDLRVWDMATRKNTPLHDVGAAREAIGVVFFPDNDMIMSYGSNTRWPLVYSTKDKRSVMSILGRGHSASSTDAVVSPDGKHAVTSALDGKLIYWNLAACIAEYVKKKQSANDDGKATYCHSPKTQPATFTSLPTNALALAYSHDGKTLAVSLDNKEVRLYETSQWKLLKTFPKLTDVSKTLAFHPNGAALIAGTVDGKLMIGDTSTAMWTRTILNNDPVFTYKVHKVVIRDDGKYIASGWSDRTAKIHDFATGKLVELVTDHFGDVFGVDFSHDGKLLATSSGDKHVRLWGCK